MTHKRNIPGMVSVIGALLISGCMVGPDFKPPAAPDVKGYVSGDLPKQTALADTPAGAAQTFTDDKNIPAEWWKLFGSDSLNTLMEQALKASPDLQGAQASLRQAQENVYAGEGALFPVVNLTPSVTREKFSPAAFGETGIPSSIFTLYNASVTVSYGLDVFGASRRAIESLAAQADFQRFELEATYLTLTTNIVTAAVQEASLREQIKETQNIVDIERRELDVLNKQLALGGIARSAVLAQEAVLAQTEAQVAPLEKQLAQKRDQLSVLAGRFPAEKMDQTFELGMLHLPEDLPLSLPSKLVGERPDIKASESLLHAASAKIGVATAAMLPQITLSGSYGPEATTFSGLSAASAPVWSIGAGLLQPIFNGGMLLHERRAAVAAYDAALAHYKGTVLLAFGNVADTLRALQYDADALRAEVNADQAAKSSLDLADVQFQAGSISYPQLLDAQRAYASVRIALVQAQATRFADTAALFQALGGSWWNRPDTTDTTQILSKTEHTQ